MAQPALPADVVYFIRPGDRNEELRYSLRSLANLPHERVWIIGHLPPWVADVHHVPGNRLGSKWWNVYDNLRIACRVIDADRFVVMNDDFFVLNPVDELPSWNRGLLADHIAVMPQGEWRRSLERTRQWLGENGIPNPLSYELHVPVVMESGPLAEILALAAADGGPLPSQWRTLYGNWWQVPSTRAADCKISRRGWDADGLFLSTEDRLFRSHDAGFTIRRLFREPCRYEKEPDMENPPRNSTLADRRARLAGKAVAGSAVDDKMVDAGDGDTKKVAPVRAPRSPGRRRRGAVDVVDDDVEAAVDDGS